MSLSSLSWVGGCFLNLSLVFISLRVAGVILGLYFLWDPFGMYSLPVCRMFFSMNLCIAFNVV